MVLHATIRQIPPDHRGGYDLKVAKISAEGETYEIAKERLEADVPPKWQMISIGTY